MAEPHTEKVVSFTAGVHVSGVNQQVSANPVSLRRFPYPFKAALSICSDIDGTTTLDRFLTIQEFLNTQTSGPMGEGLGLEIGNSFFPFAPDDAFAYFSSRDEDRDVIEALIRSGHIDCIHSYGDGIFTRAKAIEVLETLDRKDCMPDVWIDHAKAPSNLGKDVTPGTGDLIDSPIYHADLLQAFGIKFIWRGRGSSIVGHGLPFTTKSFTGIFDPAHSAHSALNIAKEITKTLLANAGNRRFALHSRNDILAAVELLDSSSFYEFKRCNCHWRGLSHGHDSVGLAYVIRQKNLQDLVQSEGYMVIYTHLGVGPKMPIPIPERTRAALRELAKSYRLGDIYVTTTSKLLNYYVNRRYLQWSSRLENNRVVIAIHGVSDPIGGSRLPSPDELQGITFYVLDRSEAMIELGAVELHNVERNRKDHTGRESISIPREFLLYPLPVRRLRDDSTLR